MTPKPTTPWQRVFARFGLSQAELAREMGCHRSRISVKVRDARGLISGEDQEKLLAAAGRRKVKLTPGDLLPEVRLLAGPQ